MDRHPTGRRSTPFATLTTPQPNREPHELRSERLSATRTGCNCDRSLARQADLATEIEGLNARLGLPGSLGALGVPESVIPEMADKAEKDHSTPTNPRPCSAADYAALMWESIARS